MSNPKSKRKATVIQVRGDEMLSEILAKMPVPCIACGWPVAPGIACVVDGVITTVAK